MCAKKKCQIKSRVNKSTEVTLKLRKGDFPNVAVKAQP